MIDPSDWQLTLFPFSYFSRAPRYENSYELVNENNGQQIAQGGNFENRKTYSTNLCLPQACYALTVKDSYGDGLNAGGNGGYSLNMDGVEIASADSNDSFELNTHQFANLRQWSSFDSSTDTDTDSSTASSDCGTDSSTDS
jgi:hypothetical protein